MAQRLVTEGFCILLKGLAYHCLFMDLVPIFSNGYTVRPMEQIMNDLNQQWLSPEKLISYADAVHQSGAASDNCWGFVDGNVRPVCLPSIDQRVLYNSHKKVHAIKFQSIVTPNGLIANLYGPVEGRRHDSGMLADSGILLVITATLQRCCRKPFVHIWRSYLSIRKAFTTPFSRCSFNSRSTKL